ncbi:bifunctional diguanylate cyclase/phosphodiesterase [Variovorax sp. HJSM1_2]|uniref:bifunctional diguanylate cyclase/phosphodiesterase n=1 Tax=Variovorax sp. HJSM1_2 TaxID=3366263 RepID=UPI003BD966FA
MPDLDTLASPTSKALSMLRKLNPVPWLRYMGLWELAVMLFSLLLLAMLWGYSAERAEQELRQQTDAAVQKAHSLTRLFEAQTSKTLKNLDLALEFVARDYLAGGRQLQLAQLLASKLLDKNTSRELAVINERGQLALTVSEMPNPDLSDREYFRILRDSPARRLYIGQPVRSRSTSKWLIPVAHRMTGPGGEFKGIVVCGIDPAYFVDDFNRSDLNESGVVTLLGGDGITRALRRGDVDRFGEDTRSNRLLEKAQQAPAGDYVGASVFDEIPRFQSYQTLIDYDLIASVGLSVDESLAAVRERVRRYRQIELLASGLILMFGATVIVGSVLRRRAQERAHVQERQRQAILDNISEIAWFKDAKSRFLAVNLAFTQMAGRKLEDIVGKTDFELWPAPLAQAYFANDQQVMRDGVRLEVEEDLAFFDGSIRTFESTKSRVTDGDGRLVGTVGIARDITRRKQEDAVRRLSAKAFESVAEGIMVTDENRCIVSVNQAFCRISGYQPDEVLGKHPRLLQSGRHDKAFYQGMWEEINSKGFWQGEIWDRRKNGEIFPELLSISAVKDDAGKTIHYVGICSDITSLKGYEERLRYQAEHDALTGLPNRFQFQERFSAMLERSDRQGTQVAVMMLDLDRFKHVNDSLGHAAGDQLLQQVAGRLKLCLRQVDIVGRFGGDEFCVLLGDVSHPKSVATIANKILDAFGPPFSVAGHELFISCSIGASCYPADAADTEGLLKNADAAMYQAKSAGRNNFQFFSAEINARAMETLLMSSSLRLALERNELLLHYQPRIDLRTGRISGAEALVRWQHPELGLLPPNRFISIAEETGLIDALSDWVLKQACRQMRTWLDAGLKLQRVAVNLAARQFSQTDCAARIGAVLSECGLDARYLELEMTESMVMQQPERVVQVLTELKRMGIALAIDDFGTGYSSLSYLKRFPLDYLKIDRSFVKDIPENSDDVAITLAIIAMAKSLGLQIIAEGVETPAQRDFLYRHACENGQGYLFSRPVVADQLAILLQNEHNSASS